MQNYNFIDKLATPWAFSEVFSMNWDNEKKVNFWEKTLKFIFVDCFTYFNS